MIMKKIGFLLVLFIGMCVHSSGADKGGVLKGSGNIVTETRNAKMFNSVKISGPVRTSMTDDTNGKIVIRADDNVMPFVKTIFDGYELIVKVAGPYGGYDNVSIEVNIPYVRNMRRLDVNDVAYFSTRLPIESYELDIEASGAAGIYLGNIDVSKLDLDLSGSSKLEISASKARECEVDLSGASCLAISRIDSRKCDIEMSGASKIDIEGVSEYCDLDMSGASQVNASKFSVRNYKVDMSGSSRANVKCVEIISGDVSGAARLQCIGNPQRYLSTSAAAKVSFKK